MDGGFNKRIYYHCARSANYDCDEPYITLSDLIKQLIAHINTGNVKIDKAKIAKRLKSDTERFHQLRSDVLHQEYWSGNLGEIENEAVTNNDKEMAINYLKHILNTGSPDDRREALGMIRTKFKLSAKELKLIS